MAWSEKAGKTRLWRLLAPTGAYAEVFTGTEPGE
jgi:hypothetical protein